MEKNNILLTVKEAAQNIFRKKEQTVRTWVREGKIPQETIKRIGTSIYFKKDKLEEFLLS